MDQLDIIKTRPFYGCANLGSINLSRIDRIGKDAFAGTSICREFNLQDLNLDDAEEVSNFIERNALNG